MRKHWHDLIPYYVAGTLPQDEREALETHLVTCGECREATEDWRLIADATRLQAAAHDRALPPSPPLPSQNSRRRRDLPPFSFTFRRNNTNKEDAEMNSDVMVRPAPRIWGTNLRPMALVTMVLLVALGAFLVFSLLPDGQGSATLELLRSTEEVNTDAFNVYIDEVWNGGDLDKLNEVLTVDHVRHDPLAAEDITGVEAVSTVIAKYRTAFPDMQVVVDNIVANEDQVWAQLTFTGTHSQPLQLGDVTVIPASNNTVTWTVTKISRYEVGKIAELWIQADTLDLMQQIGTMPSLQRQAIEEQNKEIVRGAIDLLWNNNELSSMDMRDFYATVFEWNVGPESRTVTTGQSVASHDFAGTRTWPDRQTTIQNLVADGDIVIAYVRTAGTYEGQLPVGFQVLLDPDSGFQSTGEYAEWDWILMYRLEDGKILAEWSFWNREFIEPHNLVAGQ